MDRPFDSRVNCQVVPSEWIAMEHYRLHTVEAWPESPHKEVLLAAIDSALAGLLRDPMAVRPAHCSVCGSRGTPARPILA